MNIDDIPKLPRAIYTIDVPWNYLERHVVGQMEKHLCPLDLEPDFQRAHVWTEAQRVAYVEYALQGGEVGKNLVFNCPGWMTRWQGPYEIVDGKQRLESVRRFMRGELAVFGGLRYGHELTGHIGHEVGFRWQVCALERKTDLLQLYLNINAGGTPHAPAELDRVRQMYLAALEEGR